MPTILVVEDDDADREHVRHCLKDLDNLEILFAREGGEALEQISRRLPDLVLTDLLMPGMDGHDLVKRIRSDFPLVPVLLMTSQGCEQIALGALRAGAASYVPKKDLGNDLVDTVEHVLTFAEARRSRRKVLGYLEHSAAEFHLENDPSLISPLAGYFQENLEHLGFGTETVRTQVGVAIMEALSNAMIHGNLEIGSELKHLDREKYQGILNRRRQQHPYAGRKVRCSSRESKERIEYTIRDQGQGFDPASLPDPTAPKNVLGVAGRGILLIRTFMDEVKFNQKGNEIRMIKNGLPSLAVS